MIKKPTYEALKKRVQALEQAASMRRSAGEVRWSENGERLQRLIGKAPAELTMSDHEMLRERLANAIEMAHLGPWEYDVDQDRFIFNDHFYKMFRTTCEQVGGYSMSSAEYARRFVYPDDVSFVADEIRKAIETTDPHFSRQIEHRILYADGEVGYISVRYIIFKNADGRTVKTYGVNQDITERRKAEEAVRDSEKKYRALYEEANNPIVMIDEDGRYIDANEAALDFLECGRDELFRKHLWDFSSPDQLENQDSEHASFMRRRTLEKQFFFNGKIKTLLLNVVPIQLKDKFVLYGIGQDISERKRIESSLRESEEKIRLTFNASPDAVNINRLNDGLYVSINEGFTRLTGFTRDDVIGKSSLDINIWHDPADRKKLVEELQKNGFCDNLEAQFRRKDGSLTTALMSARILSLKGRPHIVSITRDISERKKAEAERERLLLAIEQANELVVITDALGIIQYVNPAFEKITGYSEEQAIGQNPRILKSGHHDREFYESLWQTVLAGRPWTGRLINKRKNGTLFTLECSISPIKDRIGELENFVWISRDITNELELEKRVSQAQRMEAIGTLAGGIAHDFNNLIFPITGLSEMLMEDTASDSPNHENAEEIFKAAKRAGELVRQILSFSRQSDNKKTPIRIQQILKEVLKLTRATIPSNIEITQSLQHDCSLAMADPTQVHQIAMNLITNAYHAVEENGGKISISVSETDLAGAGLTGVMPGPGKYALLSVSDTGHGIAPADMGKIFEPYFTTKEQGKGTGLGLSVVYGIVKDHGGDIQVVSELGKGSRFDVYLPLMKKEPLSLNPETEAVSSAGSERILLVDDEASIVRLLKQMLERLGYQVKERTSSIEALNAFRAGPDGFDLVISDLTMPNMTGDQLSKELIAIRPDIPVIICTGFSERIDSEKAAALGVKGFLMKPIAKSDIAQMVRKVLDASKTS
jgi:PAS domain S-box-containing protein